MMRVCLFARRRLYNQKGTKQSSVIPNNIQFLMIISKQSFVMISIMSCFCQRVGSPTFFIPLSGIEQSEQNKIKVNRMGTENKNVQQYQQFFCRY